MVGFTLLLIAALTFRVYRAAQDLGMMRISERQARLAAESGISYAVETMRQLLASSERSAVPAAISAAFFADSLVSDNWISFGQKASAFFRITSIRRLSIGNKPETPLLDEELQFQILAEGRCGKHRYSTSAVVQLYDLVKTFAAFSSLDEYYYGTPVQPWVERSGGLEPFVEANAELFDSGRITRLGICHDPVLLHRLFAVGGPGPFAPASGTLPIEQSYGGRYSRAGESPCVGPLYCESPVVVDSHIFAGPVQTALFCYRRGNSQPRILMGNTAVAMNSSLRMQHAVDSLQGRNPSDALVDRDANLYASYIPPWRPDFDFLRQLSKKSGIYIDSDGRGFLNGSPTEVDYHPGEAHLYSDSYRGPNSRMHEQDELDERYVILSTEMNFKGYNNISAANLMGARIVFSERSVYLRGDIGSDLIIVTPGHIFITGPTNIDSSLNLLLLAGEGTALSTVDLEKIIKENNPGSEFVDAAREWLIRAVIYKPGAGVYTTASRPQKGDPVSFRRLFSGQSLKIRIHGACLGGNLQRWIDNTEPDSLKIMHDPQAADRLPVKPVALNLLRLRSRPDR
jgi:hypothetical protein